MSGWEGGAGTRVLHLQIFTPAVFVTTAGSATSGRSKGERVGGKVQAGTALLLAEGLWLFSTHHVWVGRKGKEQPYIILLSRAWYRHVNSETCGAGNVRTACPLRQRDGFPDAGHMISMIPDMFLPVPLYLLLTRLSPMVSKVKHNAENTKLCLTPGGCLTTGD